MVTSNHLFQTLSRFQVGFTISQYTVMHGRSTYEPTLKSDVDTGVTVSCLVVDLCVSCLLVRLLHYHRQLLIITIYILIMIISLMWADEARRRAHGVLSQAIHFPFPRLQLIH